MWPLLDAFGRERANRGEVLRETDGAHDLARARAPISTPSKRRFTRHRRIRLAAAAPTMPTLIGISMRADEIARVVRLPAASSDV